MVGYYFDKRRAFATGIAVCGSGIGAFVFAPLCHYLLEVYSWKGATWILAGICLQGVLIGALFRPLTSSKKPVSSSGKKTLEKCEVEKSKLNDKSIKDGEVGTLKGENDTQRLLLNDKRVKSLADADKKNRCTHSMHNLSSDSVPVSKEIRKSIDNLPLASDSHRRSSGQEPLKKVDVNNPLYRKDIFYSGSIQNLPEFQKAPDMDTYIQSVTEIPDQSGDAAGEGERKGVGRSVLAVVSKQMESFTLLKNPIFLIYGISCFLCMTGKSVFFIWFYVILL